MTGQEDCQGVIAAVHSEKSLTVQNEQQPVKYGNCAYERGACGYIGGSAAVGKSL